MLDNRSNFTRSECHLEENKCCQIFFSGLLLYPDKREKMVTTTEREFGPKTCPKVEPKKILQCNLTLDGMKII